MRTAAVKRLIELALASVPKPHTEDVIDDVFSAIERDPDWLKEYQALCGALGRTVVNTWGGFWVASFEGRATVKQVSSEKSKLIDSYSKLSPTKTKPAKKVKEPEALQAMAAYYQEHKSELPARVRDSRQLIVERLMEGLVPEQAFSAVLANRS